MKLGTKSLLYGAHAFWLHPWFVALAWTRLYGFPWDPRLWASFALHDVGYWGKAAMDTPEGEMHPILGARIMGRLFGASWGEFTLLHSRYFARRLHKRYSKLCCADKYAIALTPAWLYLPMVRATGELPEYMGTIPGGKYSSRPHRAPAAWFASVQDEMRRWVAIHRDADRDDQWRNGFDPKDVPLDTLPGYLDGGFEPARYRVAKADGTVNPDAKFLVVRYDSSRDPHAVRACLMYAASVYGENRALADGIVAAVRRESGLDRKTFDSRYDAFYGSLIDALLCANWPGD